MIHLHVTQIFVLLANPGPLSHLALLRLASVYNVNTNDLYIDAKDTHLPPLYKNMYLINPKMSFKSSWYWNRMIRA